jgi:hypothetical protein
MTVLFKEVLVWVSSSICVLVLISQNVVKIGGSWILVLYGLIISTVCLYSKCLIVMHCLRAYDCVSTFVISI